MGFLGIKVAIGRGYGPCPGKGIYSLWNICLIREGNETKGCRDVGEHRPCYEGTGSYGISKKILFD